MSRAREIERLRRRLDELERQAEVFGEDEYDRGSILVVWKRFTHNPTQFVYTAAKVDNGRMPWLLSGRVAGGWKTWNELVDELLREAASLEVYRVTELEHEASL